jgi:hypothetical protein
MTLGRGSAQNAGCAITTSTIKILLLILVAAINSLQKGRISSAECISRYDVVVRGSVSVIRIIAGFARLGVGRLAFVDQASDLIRTQRRQIRRERSARLLNASERCFGPHE